jgi:hypothetical protein
MLNQILPSFILLFIDFLWQLEAKLKCVKLYATSSKEEWENDKMIPASASRMRRAIQG